MKRDRAAAVLATLRAYAPDPRAASVALDRALPLELADVQSAEGRAGRADPATGARDPQSIRHG